MFAVLNCTDWTAMVNVDIFSCSTELNSLEAIDNLRWIFGACNACIQEVLRTDGSTVTKRHSKLISAGA